MWHATLTSSPARSKTLPVPVSSAPSGRSVCSFRSGARDWAWSVQALAQDGADRFSRKPSLWHLNNEKSRAHLEFCRGWQLQKIQEQVSGAQQGGDMHGNRADQPLNVNPRRQGATSMSALRLGTPFLVVTYHLQWCSILCRIKMYRQ